MNRGRRDRRLLDGCGFRGLLRHRRTGGLRRPASLHLFQYAETFIHPVEQFSELKQLFGSAYRMLREIFMCGRRFRFWEKIASAIEAKPGPGGIILSA